MLQYDLSVKMREQRELVSEISLEVGWKLDLSVNNRYISVDIRELKRSIGSSLFAITSNNFFTKPLHRSHQLLLT